MLASHLFEIMPESSLHQQLVPKIRIELDDGVSINFSTEIRQKTKPYIVGTKLEYPLSAVRGQCWSFMEAAKELGKMTMTETNIVILALQQAAGFRIGGDVQTIDCDTKTFKFMVQISK